MPKPFLKNKLTHKASRIKLRDKVVYPPFDWVFEFDKKDVSKETLLQKATEANAPSSELACAFYLQNHFEEAFDLYMKRYSEGETGIEQAISHDQVKVRDTDFTVVQESEVQESPKKIKKLTQKITNLTKEKEQLIKQVQNLQGDLKEKLAQKQEEINKLYSDLSIERKERETALKEIDFLKEENDQLKMKGKITESMPKKTSEKIQKVAFVGHPKNKGILKSDVLDIEVIESSGLKTFIARADQFAYIYLLTWRFPEEEFAALVPADIKKRTTNIESFIELKKELEGISHVE